MSEKYSTGWGSTWNHSSFEWKAAVAQRREWKQRAQEQSVVRREEDTTGMVQRPTVSRNIELTSGVSSTIAPRSERRPATRKRGRSRSGGKFL